MPLKITEISCLSQQYFQQYISNLICAKSKELIEHIQHTAYNHSANGLYRTFLLGDKNKAIAYISFSIVSLSLNDKQSAKRHFEPISSIQYPIPALKITRLLVSDPFCSKGIGSMLLVLADILGLILCYGIGCRLLVVDSKEQSVAFYKKNGFVLFHNKANTHSMMKIIDLLDKEPISREIIDNYIAFSHKFAITDIKSILLSLKTHFI